MNTRALKEGEEVAKRSIFYLFWLGGLKLVIGLLTGMSVIIADAFNTFADTLGLFASYLGLHLSRKGSSKHFKYGYYKIETFAAFLISLGILYVGYVILLQGIDTWQNPSEARYRPFAILTTLYAILHSRRLESRLRIAAQKTNSPSLEANARDKRMDLFAGIGILISILANYRGIPHVEGAITIGIALMILKEGLVSTKDSVFFLLDYWDDPILTRRIKRILHNDKELVSKVKKVRLRRAGAFIFGEAYIEVTPYAAMQDLRSELDLLKSKVRELNPYIKDFSIFTDIADGDDMRIALPVKQKKGLQSKLADNMKSTKAYLFAEIKKNKIVDHYTRDIPDSVKEKPLELAEFIKKENVNVLFDNKLNSLVYFNLRRTHHILIYPHFANVEKAKQALALFLIDSE